MIRSLTSFGMTNLGLRLPLFSHRLLKLSSDRVETLAVFPHNLNTPASEGYA